eukprot:15470398-Alexandrium_andersonii.AAC.1
MGRSRGGGSPSGARRKVFRTVGACRKVLRVIWGLPESAPKCSELLRAVSALVIHVFPYLVIAGRTTNTRPYPHLGSEE